MNLLNFLHPLGVVRWLHEPQSTIIYLGFPHSAGRYQAGESPFSSPCCWSCANMEGFLSGDENLSYPGAAKPRRCPERKISPRAFSISPRQSVTSQWGWGFHTVRGGVGPGRSPFSSARCCSCRDMQGFLILDGNYPPRVLSLIHI